MPVVAAHDDRGPRIRANDCADEAEEEEEDGGLSAAESEAARRCAAARSLLGAGAERPRPTGAESAAAEAGWGVRCAAAGRPLAAVSSGAPRVISDAAPHVGSDASSEDADERARGFVDEDGDLEGEEGLESAAPTASATARSPWWALPEASLPAPAAAPPAPPWAELERAAAPVAWAASGGGGGSELAPPALLPVSLAELEREAAPLGCAAGGGGGGGGTELDPVAPLPLGIAELEARAAAIEQQESRLRLEYDAEVRRCADLRDAAEVAEGRLAQANGPSGALQQAREMLAAADEAECRAVMGIEDELACCGRLLDGRQREVEQLEGQLHALQLELRRAQESDPSAVLEALEAAARDADRELSALLAGAREREEALTALDADLRGVLDYMMLANVAAAGGPGAAALGPEDFLPSDVRAELGLSEHGARHLADLDGKYESLAVQWAAEQAARRAAERAEAADRAAWAAQVALAPALAQDPARPGDGALPAGWPALLPPGAGAWAAAPGRAQGEDEEAPGLLLAEDCTGEVEEELWGADARRHGASTAALPRGPASVGEAAAARSLEEEGCVLQAGVTEELRLLAEALRRPPLPHGEGGPSWALARAAARGDVAQAREALPPPGTEPGDVLGWSAWHVAAAYGHVGVLEVLKDDVVNTGAHHLGALDRRTRMGFPPLGLACLSGQVDAARSLLAGMAPVDSADLRGNTPLVWASLGGAASALVPMLLEARADLEAVGPALRPAVSAVLEACLAASPPADALGSLLPDAGGCGGRQGGASGRDHGPAPDMQFVEPYRLVHALGSRPPESAGLLSYAVSILKAPVRDSMGFAQNRKARDAARLSAEEAAVGVWSHVLINYTHAGIAAAVDTGMQHGDPTNAARNRQAAVLTPERLLFFNAASWSLSQVVSLSELAEISLSSYSSTLLVLRMHSLADVVLDIAASVRERLVDELALASNAVATMWGGADFGTTGVRVENECETIVPLMDAGRKRGGTLAFLESDVFILLPYAPSSAFLADGDAFFFGLLDMHKRAVTGPGWKWQTCFFVLKSGVGIARRLLWTLHPNDEVPVGSVHLSQIRAVQALDTPDGEACLIVDWGGHDASHALTLRSSSPQTRQDWIEAIRLMQAGL